MKVMFNETPRALAVFLLFIGCQQEAVTTRAASHVWYDSMAQKIKDFPIIQGYIGDSSNVAYYHLRVNEVPLSEILPHDFRTFCSLLDKAQSSARNLYDSSAPTYIGMSSCDTNKLLIGRGNMAYIVNVNSKSHVIDSFVIHKPFSLDAGLISKSAYYAADDACDVFLFLSSSRGMRGLILANVDSYMLNSYRGYVHPNDNAPSPSEAATLDILNSLKIPLMRLLP